MSKSLILEFIEEVISQEIPNSKLRVPKGQVLDTGPSDPVGQEIEPDIFDMIQKSYAGIGGHAKIKSPKDVGGEYSVWQVADIDADPEPDVANLGSPSGSGIKAGAVATDGTPEAKTKLMAMLKSFFTNPGNWGEVSGAMANILIKKLGLKPIEDEQKVRSLLKGKEIEWVGDKNPEGDNMGASGWYVRNIGGQPHAKIIVGNV